MNPEETVKTNDDAGSRIRHARERANMSQLELAVKAGLGLNTVQRAETIQRVNGLVSEKTLEAISKVLRVPIDSLQS